MEVCEAGLRLLPAIRRRSFRSSLFGARRFMAPYISHRMTLQNVIKINHQAAIYNCLLKSPVTSVMMKKKKKKDASGGELCKVIWTIEADLADGQLLYISGDPFTLGRWEPEMAVLLSPSTEHPNLWKAEVKVPCETNFKYNYFIRKDKWPSCDLIWRSGPEFSISVPLFSEQNKKIVVRDSWLTEQSERLPVYSWGSWIEETILAANPVTAVLSGDDHENLTSCESGYLDLKSSSIDLTVKDESYSSGKDDTSTYSNKGSDFSETFSEREQPVEEPWLLQSSTYFLQFKDSIHNPDKESIESMLERVVCPDKSFQGTESHEGRSKLTCFRELVPTLILINSSKCTMQRIAVLEDGKLVELLLEPVKDNVQCGSVYLGKITKLVPSMRGAMVNIGLPRMSLMEIRNNREPFIFPPFSHTAKEKESNGSVIGKQTEYSDTHDNEPSPDGDIEVCNGSADFDFQDDPVLFSHEDFEENEIGDDFNVPGVLQGNLNGSAVDYGGEEADFDDYGDGNGHQLEGESETVNDFLPVEMEDSHVSQPPHTLKRSVDASCNGNKWAHVRKGTKIIVQIIKEELGNKSASLTAYPVLKSRFWILMTRWDQIGVSKKIIGTERTRLRVIAKTLQPPGFGLKVRSVAAGHSLEELQEDLEGLLSTWKDIIEKAKSAALAADEGFDRAVPVILERAMSQTLSVVQDCFNEVLRMVVDSPRTYREVTNYLQEIAPDLCDRVELYDKKNPIFDEYGIEEEINNMLNKRVPIANGGSLVIEQTEALVSIDVNGGRGMLGQETSPKKAVLDVNLAAAKQIARELRLRDIGGIIVVDFIDMSKDLHRRLIYEEMKKAVERDQSAVKVSELSKHGLMEITRKRVRPSVTFMITEPCTCCHATGRVEALETTFSKIEHKICRLLAKLDQKTDLDNPDSWPRFILKVEGFMGTYLTTGKKPKFALLNSSLKVWLLLKVTRDFTRGMFEVIPFTDSKKNDQQHQVALSRLQQTKAGNNIPSRKLNLFPVKRWKTDGR